ncbi:MAG: hypothetical protein IJA34_08455 [Lachnospiraceae bacterium]|nr:hypothetical protein [Lachnospiraceae bacterium]
MASNSANCKTWLIAIIAAITTCLYNSENISNIYWIMFIPTMLFYILDCYYLGLERRFIKIENIFIEQLRKGQDGDLYVFNVREIGGDIEYIFRAMKSWSTTPFYLIITISIYCLKFIH